MTSLHPPSFQRNDFPLCIICNCSLVFLQVTFACDVLRPGGLTCPKKDLLQLESLSSLLQPFHCTGCFQMFCNSELAVMRESICSLKKR